MRPTGRLHLGHWVGALEQWVTLQRDHECFFMVADWHALMSEYERPQAIAAHTVEMVADWLAAGVDPERSVVFRQSQVVEHLELAFVFSTFVPLARLERVPTYKEQLREAAGRELATHAFLGYPLLQAADILIYRATHVPVGEDQSSHLELAREIARKFNATYASIFPEPAVMLTTTPRLLGTDGRKMSKSYGNDIALGEEPSTIRQKVRGMFTDPQRVYMKDPGHPEVCNVYRFYQLFRPAYAPTVYDYCTGARKGCTECKADLATTLVEHERLAGLRARRTAYLAGTAGAGTVLEILLAGEQKAAAVARATLQDVRRALGFGDRVPSLPLSGEGVASGDEELR